MDNLGKERMDYDLGEGNDGLRNGHAIQIYIKFMQDLLLHHLKGL